MALAPHTAGPRVMVVGKDPLIRRTLSKVLDLDDGIDVLDHAGSLAAAPIARLRPDVVILDQSGAQSHSAASAHLQRVAPGARLFALDALRDMTIAEVLKTIKQMAAAQPMELPAKGADEQAGCSERNALAALSQRELEVVRLVAEGLSNKEISSRLSLSDKTVKNHISHILAKMNLTARTQVAVCAIRAGMV